jgi:hypothetical protein
MAWLDAFRGRGPKSEGDVREGAGREPSDAHGRLLACAKCQNPVTDKAAMIAVNGLRTHVFTNPDGYRFRIGCFAKAHGLRGVGEPTLEYTWFAGFSWQVQVCSRCQEQLGWLYRSSDSSFYGLILTELLEIEGEAP